MVPGEIFSYLWMDVYKRASIYSADTEIDKYKEREMIPHEKGHTEDLFARAIKARWLGAKPLKF